LFFSLLVACNKEDPTPPTIVNGQVLEQGTNKPLEGVKVILMEGTFGGSSGTYSYYPIDTFLTDKDGKFSYEHKIAASRKAYELWYAKDNYFDISSISFNDKTTRVSLNKTLNTTIKLVPFAWLTIRVVNESSSDKIKIGGPWEAGGLDDIYVGKNVNLEFTKKTQGGLKAGILWWITKNNDLKFHSDSIYVKPHDTTYYQIKY
jgi:5-hydroxyisourate hydrolase-like protein (transthyretin family)